MSTESENSAGSGKSRSGIGCDEADCTSWDYGWYLRTCGWEYDCLKSFKWRDQRGDYWKWNWYGAYVIFSDADWCCPWRQSYGTPFWPDCRSILWREGSYGADRTCTGSVRSFWRNFSESQFCVGYYDRSVVEICE